MIRLTAAPGVSASTFVRERVQIGEEAVAQHARQVCVGISHNLRAIVRGSTERQVNRGGMSPESHGFHGY
jgi:hypothetical protein